MAREKVYIDDGQLIFRGRYFSRNSFIAVGIALIASAVLDYFEVWGGTDIRFFRYSDIVTRGILIAGGIYVMFKPVIRMDYRLRDGYVEVFRSSKLTRKIPVRDIKKIGRRWQVALPEFVREEVGLSVYRSNVVIFAEGSNAVYPVAVRERTRFIEELLKLNPEIEVDAELGIIRGGA